MVAVLPRLERQAVVLGSGPQARPPEGFATDWDLLTVNGSQVLAQDWGKAEPELTLFGTTVLGMRPSNRAAQAVLRGQRTKCLVMVRDGSNSLIHQFNLLRIGYRFDTLKWLTVPERAALLSKFGGRELGQNLKPSNGVFLVLLALSLKCPRVLMTGFSLKDSGHGYNDKGHPRNHVEADHAVLNHIAGTRRDVFVNDPDFAAVTGLPLLDSAIR